MFNCKIQLLLLGAGFAACMRGCVAATVPTSTTPPATTIDAPKNTTASTTTIDARPKNTTTRTSTTPTVATTCKRCRCVPATRVA